MKIFVSSLALAPRVMADERPSHLVSLLSPEEIDQAPSGHPSDRHLRLALHDIRDEGAQDGETPPGADHVAQLIAFCTAWPGTAPLLVHCWAGISRSTAGAYIAACARNPKADERIIAATLRAAGPMAWPNPILIDHADKALAREGRMIAAIAALGMPDDIEGGAPFHIPAVFPAAQ